MTLNKQKTISITKFFLCINAYKYEAYSFTVYLPFHGLYFRIILMLYFSPKIACLLNRWQQIPEENTRHGKRNLTDTFYTIKTIYLDFFLEFKILLNCRLVSRPLNSSPRDIGPKSTRWNSAARIISCMGCNCYDNCSNLDKDPFTAQIASNGFEVKKSGCSEGWDIPPQFERIVQQPICPIFSIKSVVKIDS